MVENHSDSPVAVYRGTGPDIEFVTWLHEDESVEIDDQGKLLWADDARVKFGDEE